MLYQQVNDEDYAQNDEKSEEEYQRHREISWFELEFVVVDLQNFGLWVYIQVLE